MNTFPTDKEVLNMGKQAFINLYLKKSYEKEFQTTDGFDKWVKVWPQTYSSCMNNALDVWELICIDNEQPVN